jgi:hypothetical protein
MAEAHWKNFLYAHTARHWHALWLRYAPDGTIKSEFNAERIFRPLSDTEGSEMRVVYHYPDERGTVDTGPACGPWRITKAEQNAADGLQHPSQTVMTTLMLPGGPSAWCSKASSGPCAAELFMHHGEHLRMSAGVVQAADGTLQQLSLIREDARGPWPSADWSTDKRATPSSAAGLRAALAQAAAPVDARGHGHAISARLHQSSLAGVPFAATRLGAATSDDALLLGPDHTAIVAPRQRIAGAPFSYAAAWWPDGGAGVASCIYTIEAHWDATGNLAEVRHLTFGGHGRGRTEGFSRRGGLSLAVALAAVGAAWYYRRAR